MGGGCCAQLDAAGNGEDPAASDVGTPSAAIALRKAPSLKSQGSQRSGFGFYRSKSSLVVEEADQQPDFLKRQKSSDLAKVVPAESVRVRNPAGNHILSLGRDEAVGMTVGVLRERVGDSVGRCVEEIKLIALMKLLEEDADTLEALIAQSEPLEVLSITSQMPQFDSEKPMLEQLSTLKVMLMSHSAEYQMEAAQVIRKALSIERDPPIDAIIETGIVPRLISICEVGASDELVYEALWALTNMASGTTEQCQVLMDSGALPMFVALLATPNDDIFEQTVWAIGNIAGDGPAFRDMAREAGAAKAICDSLDSTAARRDKLSLQRNATWALSNFCRGGGAGARADSTGFAPVLGTLKAKLGHTDPEVLADACWALSYLSDGPNECIQAVLDLGVCPRVVEILRGDALSTTPPALRCAGNFATGDTQQTQAILDCGVLGPAGLLLNHEKKNLRKEACWLVSNVMAGTRQQAQAVIGSGLLPVLCGRLVPGESHDVKKEAAWAIANASSLHDKEISQQLVEQGCLEQMCGLLDEYSPQLAKIVLEFADNLLSAGAGEEGQNSFAEPVGSALGAEQLRRLAGVAADDDESSIAEKAATLLEKLHPGSAPDD